MAISSKDVRTQLNVIVDRRNRIAHEGDIDPTMGIGVKYAIDFPMVSRRLISSIELLTQSIRSSLVNSSCKGQRTRERFSNGIVISSQRPASPAAGRIRTLLKLLCLVCQATAPASFGRN